MVRTVRRRRLFLNVFFLGRCCFRRPQQHMNKAGDNDEEELGMTQRTILGDKSWRGVASRKVIWISVSSTHAAHTWIIPL